MCLFYSLSQFLLEFVIVAEARSSVESHGKLKKKTLQLNPEEDEDQKMKGRLRLRGPSMSWSLRCARRSGKFFFFYLNTRTKLIQKLTG